jgi:hypothetical protein
LFTTPVVYLWFGRIASWVARLRGTQPEDPMSLPEMT